MPCMVDKSSKLAITNIYANFLYQLHSTDILLSLMYVGGVKRVWHLWFVRGQRLKEPTAV